VHPEVGGEAGPALVPVRSAAAEVWFEAEDVRVRSVGGVDPVVGDVADHLVGLLVVLMGPLVVRRTRGQGVERQPLDPVGDGLDHAPGLKRDLQRCEVLDHRTVLGALAGVAAGQVFVAAEEAGGLAVALVEVGHQPQQA
jgi:hypothetical protein